MARNALVFKYDQFTGELDKVELTKSFMEESDLMKADILMDILECFDTVKSDLENLYKNSVDGFILQIINKEN